MIERRIIVDAPVETVYQSYAVVENWTLALPDVLDTKVLYDDGLHQEFYMTVERNGKPETVRTIRYCKPNTEIQLFQPEPPPNFEFMHGVWKFQAIDDNRTALIAKRDFRLQKEKQDEQTATESKLALHLERNLDNFKAFAERRGHIQVSRHIPVEAPQLFSCFWDIQGWNKIWSPIDNTEIDYDDGQTQIFSMKVWRDNRCESVRTVRKNIDQRIIAFYSPEPPPKLRYHAGKWKFKPAPGGTIVTAEREFEMDDTLHTEDPFQKFKSYHANLQKRLAAILESFQAHFAKERKSSCNSLI